MTLPLRHGGLGLSCTDPALASAAYLAAAAATHTAMREGLEAFRPFDGPSGTLLRPQWEALHKGAATCGSRSYARLNPTAWDTSRERKAPTRGTLPSSALTPGLCLVGRSPAPALPGTQGQRSTNCPPPSPRPACAASQCPDCAVWLRGYTPALGCRPCHAMPRSGRTAYTAPQHPQRDIALCCAPGLYCLCPRTAPSPSPRPRSRFWNCSRWLRYPR
jgi:hypothetical protein